MSDSEAVMGTTRLEAFSDGVIAIIITIMVLELKVPHGEDLHSLVPVVPVLLSYALSFVYVGIYWNNHHHLLHTCEKVTGPILWANLHLLFWLSVVPFTTGWVGESHAAPIPTALYGAVLLMAAVAFTILQFQIIASEGQESVLAKAVGKDWKGKTSLALYVAATAVALWQPWIAVALFVTVALIWLIPDPRIEKAMAGDR